MSVEEVTADVVDFAVAAYREEGRWTVAPLPPAAVTTAEGFVAALRQLPGEGGVFGVVSSRTSSSSSRTPCATASA